MKYLNIHRFLFMVLIFSLVFLVSRGIFYLASTLLAREPFSTFQFDRVLRTSAEMLNATPPPYGYTIDGAYNVSRFPLEDIPSTGVPGNYAQVTTSTGNKMVPNTQDTIYAAIEKFNSDEFLKSDIEYSVPIRVHRDETNTTVENIGSIMRQTENAFFFNTNRGTNQANLNITWKESLKANINDAGFTGSTKEQFFDFIQTRNIVDGLDINGSIPHLFFLTNTSTRSLPSVFSKIPTATEKFTPIIVCVSPAISQTREFDSGLSPIKLRQLTQELCKALGLEEYAAENASDQNIMNTTTTGGYLTNQSQNMTLRQYAKTFSSSLADEITDQSLADEITDQSLAEEASNRQAEYRNNYYDNIQYHDSEAAIRAASPGEGSGIAYVIDKDGNRVGLGKASTQPDQLFYTAGSFPFGSASYVPKYDDAVYLSKLTGETTASLLEDTAAMKGGFCTQEANNKLAIDEKCRATDKNQCASLSCCVLLGGAKCVAGNTNGPIMTGHYSDFTIRDRDYYYYQGKCYGHCPESNPF